MNMIATDADQGVVDVNVLYDEACSLIDLVHPGGKLSPIEPTDSEPTTDATVLRGAIDGAPVLFLLDGSSDDAGFDATEVVSTLAERLAETAAFTVVPLAEATEDELTSLASATTFKATLTAMEQAIGELRFAAAAPVAADTGEAPAEPSTGDPAGNEQAAPPAAAAAQPPPANPAELAERLPNLAAVDMNVAVELGRVRLPIRELLGLGTGSVIRLGTPVGESFDILVNGKPAARGDLVVVGGRLAVRIRELLGIHT